MDRVCIHPKNLPKVDENEELRLLILALGNYDFDGIVKHSRRLRRHLDNGGVMPKMSDRIIRRVLVGWCAFLVSSEVEVKDG